MTSEQKMPYATMNVIGRQSKGKALKRGRPSLLEDNSRSLAFMSFFLGFLTMVNYNLYNGAVVVDTEITFCFVFMRQIHYTNDAK